MKPVPGYCFISTFFYSSIKLSWLRTSEKDLTCYTAIKCSLNFYSNIEKTALLRNWLSYCKAYQERFYILEYAKFRGSHATVALVDLVPSRHRAFVGISCVQISPLGISWAQNFFSWLFRWSRFSLGYNRRSKIFSLGYFVGPKFLGCRRKCEKTEIQRYISNRVFYSKLISTIVSSVYTSKVLHLLN